MFTLIAENAYGHQLELTHSEAYSIKDISGLDPPEAVITTTHNAGFDGSIFNSAYMSDRLLIITLAINGPAEANRINLYKYFKSKFPVKLYYSNGVRDVYINGYTKNVAIQFFERKQIAQISIFCPEPHFSDVLPEIQAMSNTVSLFTFPFSIAELGIPFSEISANSEQSIRNDGDLETGVQISIIASGAVTNPKIYDTGKGVYMIFDLTMAAGDELRIDTRQGLKAVRLISAGIMTNVIGSLAFGSTWFLLDPGDNLFSATADAGAENLMLTFTVISQFEGV